MNSTSNIVKVLHFFSTREAFSRKMTMPSSKSTSTLCVIGSKQSQKETAQQEKKEEMMRRTTTRLLSSSFATYTVPPVQNERMGTFLQGSKERADLAAACERLRVNGPVECPPIVGGKKILLPGSLHYKREIPSDITAAPLAFSYNSDRPTAALAVEAAKKAWVAWSRTPFQDRAAIVLKAANLISTKYRSEMQAATILGQAKNAWQAEIDCIAETCDFFRFSVKYAEELYRQQPISPAAANYWNMLEYRPLEGFVAAITPFNFTAIGANLALIPALMGNTVVWKPSPAAVLSNFLLMEIFAEAGLPDGVINFLPCHHDVMEDVVMKHRDLAGVAFTGSTSVFNQIWKTVGENLPAYANYPRVSGETGGKNFHLVHPSADVNTVVAQTVRSAFEYQGQKCSACSRLYVPQSLWVKVREKLVAAVNELKLGQPDDFSTFISAVIDKRAFDKISKYIVDAKADRGTYELVAGGTVDMARGYFISPTVLRVEDPMAKTMREEIFGPVLSVFVYDDASPTAWADTAKLINDTTTYALTGSIFSQDRTAINTAADILRYAAGNLYINDKSTGAVVGQQPFGGARHSGTNDKAGAASFLMRWVSPRTIKETFDPLPQISYPHQLPDNVLVK
jgi:1-pyrroline-5-carboxylate dehydrogenase